jgi:hypothetical protein
MIVQITITRNELFLLKEMLPLWQKYADAFVFMDDNSTDGTYEYLMENKDKFNILSVMKSEINRDDISTQIESEFRQRLYDEAFKYSGNIICLDTDEYIDGQLSKEQLNQIMDNNKDMLFHMRWIQYTGENQIRIDGPWKVNYKDRVASYSTRALFKNAQMHSEHLPVPQKQAIIEISNLFIAHLQWLCKNTVAVKQYFWKITDYVVNKRFGVQTTHPSAYDASVNNFNWQYESFSFPLKVDPKIYDKHDIKSSYKYLYIKENVEKYNIPNLGDWGMGIH